MTDKDELAYADITTREPESFAPKDDFCNFLRHWDSVWCCCCRRALLLQRVTLDLFRLVSVPFGAVLFVMNSLECEWWLSLVYKAKYRLLGRGI